jgi:hypothetical protein
MKLGRLAEIPDGASQVADGNRLKFPQASANLRKGDSSYMKRMAAILSVIVIVASAFAKPDDKAFVAPSGAIIDKRDDKIPGSPPDAVIVEEQSLESGGRRDRSLILFSKEACNEAQSTLIGHSERRDSLMAPINVFAQGDSSGTSLIKTADGILWVENGENARFILEIKGADIRPMQQYPFLSVDGRPMQVHLVGIEKFHRATGDARATDLTILQAHRDWEADHHSKLLSSKLEVTSEPSNSAQNRASLIWNYSMPGGKDDQFKEQWFLTTLLGNHLLLLNTPLKTGEPSNMARDMLVKTLSTLQVSAKQIDVQALQESIRKTGKASLPNDSNKQ